MATGTYNQANTGLCWTYAGGQCVISHMLSRYGLILDFATVRQAGLGTVKAHVGGTLHEFLANLKHYQIPAIDGNVQYELDLKPKSVMQDVVQDQTFQFNRWHGLTPYVVVKLDQGYHAMAALRYTHDSHGSKTGILCKNSWAGITGMTMEVPFTGVEEIYDIDVIGVVRVRTKKNGIVVQTPVSPLQGLSGNGWGDLLSQVALDIQEAEVAKREKEGKEAEPFDIDYVLARVRRAFLENQGQQEAREDITTQAVPDPLHLPLTGTHTSTSQQST